MRRVYEATGTMEDGSTIVLETPLPVRGRVRVQVSIEAATPKAAADREAVLKAIHERQRARGHIPLTPEEIDSPIRQMREENPDAANLSR